MNASEIEALFAQTLLGEYEGENAWEAVSALRRAGSREIFERAAAWCLSDNALKRARAADILCQLRLADLTGPPWREPKWMFRDESYHLIATMLENEKDLEALGSEISALGHLSTANAVPLILRYLDHRNRDVRFAVTCALGCFPNEPPSVEGLLKLTSDEDAEVRDWAVFGLGVLGDADSPEIRKALLRCLDDPDEDVREEAAVGLGKRQDQRLIPKLQAMLDAPRLTIRVAEAAAALLGLDRDPPEWTATDYRAALITKFQVFTVG
jgi:HEAT repeat protein